MSNIVYSKVLCLNAAWLPIGTCTVKKALEDMNSIRSPKKALKIEYAKDENGQYDFSKPTEIIPLDWDNWVQLTPREFDADSIRTPAMQLRVPTVIICTKYNKLPVKTFRPTKRNIYERYGGKDYWTGEDLSYKDCTLDHVKPRSKGGGNSWENLAPTSGRVNRMKADMNPEDFAAKTGHKPHFKLSEPKAVPASFIIKSFINPDCQIFLKF